MQLSNCREFLVEGVTFDEHRRDGIHVNGPASYGMIRNIRGATGDDMVALNAWDWCNTAPAFGPIHHVLVEAIHGSPQLGGTDEIRLLPGTKAAEGVKLLPQAEARLVQVADQKPNPNYPKTTPRGGTGKAIVLP